MFPREGINFTKCAFDRLICVVCNKEFSVSSELGIHQQKSHSKKDLSRALIQLQNLLIQSKFIINLLKHGEGTKDEREYDDKDQHFLHNCMNVNDLEVLLNKEFPLTSKSTKKNHSEIKNEEMYDDRNFQVTRKDLQCSFTF